MSNTIPPITDPLGRSWRQPDPARFQIDDTHALMSQQDFERLSEYTTTMPTGVYPGKCWKGNTIKGWMLRWYGETGVEDGLEYCTNHQRLILTV